MFRKLLVNPLLYLVFIVSALLTFVAPKPLDTSFYSQVPTIIGILMGAAFASGVLVLGMVINPEVRSLSKDKQAILDGLFPKIKAHLILLVLLLDISFLAAHWPEMVLGVLPSMISKLVTPQHFSSFTLLACLFLASLSTIEVINVVFNLFMVRWRLFTAETSK